MTDIDDVTIVGDGTQNAFGNTVSRDLIVNQLNFVRGRPSMVLSEDEIDDRVAGYVPARNHALIVDVLGRHHAVALAGPPGAGAATAAIAALRDVRPGLPIRLFSTGEDDVSEIRGAERGYLVRAADEEESRLRSCLAAVRESGGFLLVVGTESQQRRFTGFLPVIPVQPPSADAVYRRRLERHGAGRTDWADWPRARELLKEASPGDARRLADLVTAIGDEREIERAYLGWREQLRGWFADHRRLRDQALLIAAATIAPAGETSVYGAALSLARELGIRLEGGGLAWCPAPGLLDLLGAEQGDDGIVFRRPGYAASVLRHVWDDYPLTRMDLLSWLSSLPTDSVIVLDEGLRRKLAEVFADLAAEHGAVEKIVQMAESWARDDEADLSYVALARTCLHPRVGGRVRRMLYKWSTLRRAPQTLKLTVVRVCQVLGETHVTIALTRLKHLATYGNEQVRDEVVDVAHALARDQPQAVADAALEWCRTALSLSTEQGSVRRAQVGLRLLLVLLASGPAHGPLRSQEVLDYLDYFARAGGERLHQVVLEAAREMATQSRSVVLDAVLAWTGNADGRPYGEAAPRAELGAAIFLRLAAERDADGFAVTLTGPAAVRPEDCEDAWSVALAAEAGEVAAQDGVLDAAWLWLGTAAARPALRLGIVSVFVAAAVDHPARRLVMVDLVRAWAGNRRDRRDVREDVLMQLLLPGWRRLLLVLWVRLRRKLLGGG